MKRLLLGDCVEHLRSMAAASCDSLVTDPPAGISFMGKDWDHHRGGRLDWIAWMDIVMTECYRVLKPGAHGLVWALPRTSHWTATALDNVGFEVRDVITHVFGTGFPKSLDISKAIDKAAGAEREVVGTEKNYGKTKLAEGKTGYGDYEGEWDITRPATDPAKHWQGWGTALKPASEHWILVRKPLAEDTVAANVLEHGVGGINIDGCRVAGHNPSIDRRETARRTGNAPTSPGVMSETKWINRTTPEVYATDRAAEHLGRFPANLVLSHNEDCDSACTDGCAVALLDEQSGIRPSGGSLHRRSIASSVALNEGHKPLRNIERVADTGGASRFFYCAKASKRDRGEGNTHPTVKSTKLMSYLVRLVTPPGGTVLDPFMGSGSTGIAAAAEGFCFIGIEQNQDYFAIAQRRCGGL